MKYFVLTRDDDPTKREFREFEGLGQAFRYWEENPGMRTIVKEVEVEIREKGI